MEQTVIILSSVTYAMKSRDLLFAKGIRAHVERVTKAQRASGCGYGVYVPDRTQEAAQILRENGIRVLGFAAHTPVTVNRMPR